MAVEQSIVDVRPELAGRKGPLDEFVAECGPFRRVDPSVDPQSYADWRAHLNDVTAASREEQQR